MVHGRRQQQGSARSDLEQFGHVNFDEQRDNHELFASRSAASVRQSERGGRSAHSAGCRRRGAAHLGQRRTRPTHQNGACKQVKPNATTINKQQ